MPSSATDLLRDVGRLLKRSHELEETLANVVRLVARWTHAGCCSIYLLEDDGESLVLRATRGLRAEAIGQVRLRVGQGIVGSCLRERATSAVPDVRDDDRFFGFPGSGEEDFQSLLAVPLMVRELAVGVLTVQTRRPRDYDESEIELLETIAAQVASIVLNARLLDRAYREGHVGPEAPLASPTPYPAGTVLRGIATSPGVAIGSVHIQPPRLDLLTLRYRPAPSKRGEWRAIERALRETVRQISDIREVVGDRFGKEFASVFTTHIMILEDQGFREKLRGQVFQHGNGARALADAMREYAHMFAAASDPTIRDRAADIEDVVRRAIGELLGVRQHNPPLRDGVIVIADRIAPSEFVLLETEKIAGMITVHGGPTSHAAIFARSLEIPSMTGLPPDVLARIRPSDQVILDGIDSGVVINPTPEAVRQCEQKWEQYTRLRHRLDELRDAPSRTRDGEDVLISANVGGLNDLDLVKRHGAQGIGLFRTEILVLSSRGFPDEEEQMLIYRRAAETVAPHWTTIRSFDLGGDKVLPGRMDREENPQLGWRSIRMLLDRPDVFETQLRAIVRANDGGTLRVMIPMLTTLDELDATRELLSSVCADLGVAKSPPLGVMLETPAAVGIADRIAPHVDFFAIGTNDLVQYTLAVDRENERVASAYDPFHPAVLAQISRVAEVARGAEIPCSVCGEFAGNPLAVPLLIGMGIRELSVTPLAVTLCRQVVRSIDAARARSLAEDAERCARGDEVRQRIARELAEIGLLDDRDLGEVMRRLLAPDR